jgi:hypothetical protein
MHLHVSHSLGQLSYASLPLVSPFITLCQGHDFLILGRSAALANPLDPSNGPIPFDASKLTNSPTPLRRDTTVLPAWGWLAVAFQTGTNPGAWLFHCHIAWHLSQGLSVLFLEQQANITSAMDVSGALGQTCPAWRTYEPTDPFQKTDSGL